jgi:starch synthase
MAKKTPNSKDKQAQHKQASPASNESRVEAAKGAAGSGPDSNGPVESKAAPGKGGPPQGSVAASSDTSSAKTSVLPEAKAKAVEPKPLVPDSAPASAQTAPAKTVAPETVQPAVEKAKIGELASGPAPSAQQGAKDKAEKPPVAQPVKAASVSEPASAPKKPAAGIESPRGDAKPARPPSFPTEAEFMANLPPLPTEEVIDESQEAEFLQAVEAEFKDLPTVEEAAPAPAWETVEVVEPEPAPEPQPNHVPPAYVIPSMYIVQITPELAPVAKVGGLADVVFGLSSELEIRGNHVEIILPKYDCLRYDHIWGLCETYSDLWVPWYGGAIHCTVFFGFVHGRKCFFIEPHSADNFFNRGGIYGFNDDVMRFAFFSRAAMEFLWKAGKQPEIIHCHDWQTALVPVFLFEIYQHLGMRHPRTCFTIHNFKHQGVTGAQLLNATALHRPEYYFHYDRMRDNHNPHALNMMKAGVVYSNFVTTVSPRHAMEAKDQGQGFGLEPTLHIHHLKYGGVVNGIDYEFWNPEIDRYIPFHYTVDNLDEKYKNKKALRDRLWIADNEKPVVAFVGRLDPQKGLELIRHAIFYTLQRGGQFVLLGSSPDGQINNYFWSLKHQFNEHPDCHIEIGFNEELSHLIYAGADMMIVPSRFEPCGLAQLIAMRYGTVPIVREIGGLADTVVDKDYSPKPLHERNGYVFRDYDGKGLEFALGRAISCYYEYPEHFRELMKNAMRSDYSWKNPGQDYLNIYDYIRDK